MSWASQRRTAYLSALAALFAVLLGFILYVLLYDQPTCFDGEENGTEDGIDCGGGCNLVCPFQAALPIVRWERFFEVTPGNYSAVAFVENPNSRTFAENVSYAFELRDERGVLVYERKGVATIPPQQLFPIFETFIETGDRIPELINFEFTSVPDWKRLAEEIEIPEVNTRDTRLERESDSPRLTAELHNETLKDMRDIKVVALLFNKDGTAVAASETIVPRLLGRESANLVFTWPRPFPEKVVEILIVPKVFSF